MILIPPEKSVFSFFGIGMHYYSVCILFGILAAFFVLVKLIAKKCYTDKNIIYDFAPSLIIVAILSARLYYVLLSLNYYIKYPFEIFYIWNGGIAIHGAILGGILYGIFYFKKRGLKFLPYADAFAAVLPLGQAIGRWGNFFNSEAFGIPASSDSLFKLYVSQKFRPEKFLDVEYFHPAFLYESVLDLLIFIVLLFVYKKTAEKFSGLVFFLYILLYSTVRIVVELCRVDTVFYLFNIPFPVLISILGIIAGSIGILKVIKQS